MFEAEELRRLLGLATSRFMPFLCPADLGCEFCRRRGTETCKLSASTTSQWRRWLRDGNLRTMSCFHEARSFSSYSCVRESPHAALTHGYLARGQSVSTACLQRGQSLALDKIAGGVLLP